MRTYPTVYNLATMNKRNLRSFELHMSLLQLAVALGIVTGSMCVAFYLGFGSGHSSGFQEASVSDLKRAMKLPISDDELEGVVSNENASAVYAKLGNNVLPPLGEGEVSKDLELPELSTIEEAPQKLASVRDIVVDDLGDVEPLLGENKSNTLKTASLGDMKKQHQVTIADDISQRPIDKSVSEAVKVMGTGESLGDVAKKKKTLGGLLDLQNDDMHQAKLKKKVEPKTTVVEQAETKKVAALLPPPSMNQAEMLKKEPAQIQPKEAFLESKETAKASLPQIRKQVKRENLVQTKVSGGWYAQVAAPRKVSDAKSLASKLRGSGFSVAIEQADVRGQIYYRVLVGPEENRTFASRLIGQLKRESYISGEPFIKKVK